MRIETGDWCRKYKDFIRQEIIDKCPITKEKGFKGCYGSACPFRTYATKSIEDDFIQCAKKRGNKNERLFRLQKIEFFAGEAFEIVQFESGGLKDGLVCGKLEAYLKQQ